MSVDEFASCQRAVGERLIQCGHVWWHRVRPFFYRPMLPFQELAPGPVRVPWPAWLGGFQHAVSQPQAANSVLNLLLFVDPQDYSLANLEKRRRHEIKSAAKHFTVRWIADASEFKQRAYPAYLAFYNRTGYRFAARRRHPKAFARWANSLYASPKVAVLGAFQDGELGAVSISHLVEDTLIYSTSFADDHALRLHVPSLMLHTLRQAAAACPGVNRIWAGTYKYQGLTGVDKFLLDRHCRLVRQPARLWVNPLAGLAIRRCFPGPRQRLLGQIPREVEATLQGNGPPPAPVQHAPQPSGRLLRKLAALEFGGVTPGGLSGPQPAPGTLVEVRPEQEILATLDQDGTLGKLPFLQEMLPYCGRRFRVLGQVRKARVEGDRLRPINNVVVLEGLRCTGAARGGCAKACRLLWHEAWLRPATADHAPPAFGTSESAAVPAVLAATARDNGGCPLSKWLRGTRPLSKRGLARTGRSGSAVADQVADRAGL